MVDLEKNYVRVCPSEFFFFLPMLLECVPPVLVQICLLCLLLVFISPLLSDLKGNYSAQYRVEAASSTVANDVIQL